MLTQQILSINPSVSGKERIGDFMFQWGSWVRIDLRKPTTLPPVDKPVLAYIEGEGQVVVKFVGRNLLEKVNKPSYYLYYNTHKPIKGHKIWWVSLPQDPDK